ncbi:hypothetical protein KKC_08492 [Listeria fleischmannii subsp. coloradonensis]|nr:hypothetical protein KKC_08492 [Listeria fleischmannii subsp. coloradonensis]
MGVLIAEFEKKFFVFLHLKAQKKILASNFYYF